MFGAPDDGEAAEPIRPPPPKPRPGSPITRITVQFTCQFPPDMAVQIAQNAICRNLPEGVAMEMTEAKAIKPGQIFLRYLVPKDSWRHSDNFTSVVGGPYLDEQQAKDDTIDRLQEPGGQSAFVRNDLVIAEVNAKGVATPLFVRRNLEWLPIRRKR